MALGHIHQNEWVLGLFLSCCPSSETGSWCSSLVHIHCIHLHGQPWVMVNLWPLCICMVVPCSWCELIFYTKILQCHGSWQLLSDPLAHASHLLLFQWWLLHLWFLLYPISFCNLHHSFLRVITCDLEQGQQSNKQEQYPSDNVKQ